MDALSLFPRACVKSGGESKKAMRVLTKFLLSLILVAGLSVVASAQKKDQDKPPKNPPTVDPGKTPKPTPQPTPKPGMAFIVAKNDSYFA